jgi:hypothetical protein
MSTYETSPAAHAMHEGFNNICYFAGWLRHPRENFFFIQQDNDETRMVPIELAEGVKLPRSFKSGDKVKVLGRLIGRKITLSTGSAIQSATVRVTNSRSIYEANLLDMPAREDYFKVIDGANASLVTPPEFGSKSAKDRVDDFTDDAALNALISLSPDGSPVWRPSDSGFETSARASNEVNLAGMLVKLNPGKVRDNGQPETATAYLRTTANPDEDIAVSIVGKYVGQLMISMRVGMTVRIEKGQLRMITHVDKDADGNPVLDAAGKPKTRRSTIIIVGSRNIKDARAMLHYTLPMPAWLIEFREERRQAAMANAARSNRVLVAGPQVAVPASQKQAA